VSRYTCPLAETIGHEYSLSPEQVRPGTLRMLASSWHPRGRDLSQELNTAASELEAELSRLGLPPDARPDNEDGRAMARQALAGNPRLLAEMERGWRRQGRP
jgi:hypothetical protein